MRKLIVFFMILASVPLMGQIPSPIPVEKVTISVDGETYSKNIPNTIPELKKLVRDLADIINDQTDKNSAERQEFTKKLEDSTKRTDEILQSINSMDEQNKKIVSGIEDLRGIQTQLDDLKGQLEKKPYSLFAFIQPGIAISGTGVGYGGGPVVGMTLYNFTLIGVSTHFYTNGVFDLGISVGMMF